MSSSDVFQSRPQWTVVARLASERLGRKYSGVYCREVAIGFRSNSKLEPVLRELGVLQESAPAEAPEPEVSKSGRSKRRAA